jgi:malate synthase
MIGPNSYHMRREEVNIGALDLLNSTVQGKITVGGVKQNCEALLVYCQSWLEGLGCKAVNYSMEDAATGEVSRYLLWSWIYHGKSTDDGTQITAAYVDKVLDAEASKLQKNKALETSLQYIKNDLRQKAPSEFLTSSLYAHLPHDRAPAKI